RPNLLRLGEPWHQSRKPNSHPSTEQQAALRGLCNRSVPVRSSCWSLLLAFLGPAGLAFYWRVGRAVAGDEKFTFAEPAFVHADAALIAFVAPRTFNYDLHFAHSFTRRGAVCMSICFKNAALFHE